MSILQRIKIASLELRKAKHHHASLAQTLIGEAEMVGKNDGNREVTDAEVIAIVKKFVKNLDETIQVASTHGNHSTAEKLHEQKLWCIGWLPTQLTTEQLREVLVGLSSEHNLQSLRDMGKLMKVLKERYDGQYDGATASTLIKGMLR